MNAIYYTLMSACFIGSGFCIFRILRCLPKGGEK